MGFTFFMDCSLIPTTTGTFYLRQTYSINGLPIATINNNPASPANQILSTLLYPHPVALPMSGPVPGNFGQTGVEMLFMYQNTGTAPLNMAFEFTDITGCAGTGYEVTNLSYATSTGGLANFGTYQENFPFENLAILQPGEFIHIKQTIDIIDCMIPCNPKQVKFQWRCIDMPQPSCEDCLPPLITNYTFSFETPTFEITREDPDLVEATHDNTCPEDELEWRVKVKNTSLYTTIHKIDVDVFQSGGNTFTLIDNSGNYLDNLDIVTDCGGCTKDPVDVNLLTNQIACSSMVSNPVGSFEHIVHDIGPGESFTFTFKTIRCCDDDDAFLNIEKMFNHWQVKAIGISACTTSIEPVIAQNNPIVIAPPSAISSHHTTYQNDIFLDCSTVAGVNSITIPPGEPTDPSRCDYRYSPTKTSHQVRLSGLTGDNNDLQVFGYSTANNITKLILQVKISCDIGLVMDFGDENLVNITSVDPNQTQTWNQVLNSFHTTNTTRCCANADYYFYFDISSLTGTGIGLINDFFTMGRLNFKFQGCCPVLDKSPYTVEFRVLLNDDCYGFVPGNGSPPICATADCCWLPLSNTGNRVHVHCPGCKMPGPIVDYFYIDRTSFGYEDADNDRIADNTSEIDGGYSHFGAVEQKAAVFGDELTDKLVGYFQPGDSDNTTSGGYTYHNMIINEGVVFKALQLHKAISVIDPNNPGGNGPVPVEFEPIGFDLYIDQPEQTSPNCVDCIDYTNADPDMLTILSLSLNKGDPAFNDFFDVQSTASDILFTFHVDDIDNAGPVFHNGFTQFAGYNEWQQYRISVRYNVCGNFQSNDPNINFIQQNPLLRKRETEINNTLFFTADGIDLSTVLATDKAPNSIDELHDPWHLEFTGLPCPTSLQPCDLITNGNFGNEFLFYCEKFSGTIDIYSTDCFNFTTYQNLPGSTNCTKEIVMNGVTTFGGRRKQDIFMFEYKTPPLFSEIFEFEVPSNDFIDPSLTQTYVKIQSGFFTGIPPAYLPGTNAIKHISFSMNGNTLKVDLETNPLNISCVLVGLTPNVDSTNLYIGDELSSQILSFMLKPNDCDLEVVVPDKYPVEDATITFNKNETSCIENTTACILQDIRNNSDDGRVFSMPNPNLAISFDNNGIVVANSNQVCWNFNITNPNTPNTPAFSAAQNIFLALPVIDDPTLDDYFSNWQLNYTVIQNTGGSISGGTSTMNSNGIIPIVTQLNSNVAATITGTLCADYLCTGGYSIELDWGWNCDNFPVDIQQEICDFQQVEIFVEDAPVRIEPDPVSALSLTNYSLCQNLKISACYTSMESGQAVPQIIEISGMPIQGLALHPTADPIIRSCDFTLNATNPPSQISTYSWSLDPVALGEVNIGNGTNGIMEISDCFCIDFVFETTCGYEGELPSFILHSESYCSSTGPDVHSPMNYPSIPYSNSSSCSDCFSISKTANTDTVMAQVSPMTWNIEVCSYNDLSNYPVNVILADLYPAGFQWISGDLNASGGPLVVQLTGPGCTTFSVTGTMNSVGNWCNIAYLYYVDAQNDTIMISDTACVEVTPNCNAQADSIVMIGVTYASSFGSGVPVMVPGNTIAINGTLIVDVAWMLFQNQTLIMGPGAEIIVPTGNLLLIDACDVYACDQMWRSITLRDQAGLIIWRSTVKDAHYTVDVADKNRLALINSTFTNNFITVNSLTNPIAANSTVYYITENIFEGTGSLNSKYPGQLQLLSQLGISSFDDYPFAGIAVANSAINFNTPYQGTGYNHFRYMSNGIVSSKCKLNVEYCKFDTIQPAINYNPGTFSSTFMNNFNGSGIFAFGGNSNVQLTQNGSFINQNIPSFTNCNFGIFADRSRLVSENNTMENMNTAYRAQLVRSDIFIRHNTLDANMDAIQLFLNDGTKNTVVWDNDIVFGNSDMGQNYCAIRVNEFNTPASNSRINYNRINFRSSATAATTGIFTQATSGWIITNNEIRMDDNVYNLEGIFMAGCDFNIASCNFIEGSGAYGADVPLLHQSAILNELGDSPVIGCNYTDATSNGVYVMGTVSGTSSIQGNDFNEHYFGLRYAMNAFTDNQYLRGNKWNQNSVNPAPPFGTGQGYMARHDDNNLLIQIHFHTANPTAGPPWLFPFHHAPANWFQQDLVNANYDCEDADTSVTPPVHYCDEFPIDCPQCRTEMDEKIAREEIENDPYTDETKYMLKKSLYYKIDDNNELLSDSLMNAFYYEMQSTPIPDFKMVNDGIKAIALPDSMLMLSLQYYRDQLQLKTEQAHSQFELVLTSIENGSLNGAAINTINNLQDDISVLINTGDSLAAGAETNRVAMAGTIESNNNQVAAATTIENNEKDANSVYLSTIAKEIHSFSPSQWSTLVSIANQCPLAGGKAVFQARSLLSLCGMNHRYNDREICGAVGIQIRQYTEPVKPKANQTKIYPNPANESVTLEYSLETTKPAYFELYSTLGKKLQTNLLIGNQGKETISTIQLPPGIYHYRIVTDNSSVAFGKLVIAR